MKPITTSITILFITLLSSPSWSETMEDLVERNGLYYKKFTDLPFTGKVTGQWDGEIKKGKRSGLWKVYYESGQLEEKGTYKDGKPDGLFEDYLENGQLSIKKNYNDGKQDGLWEYYYENGQLWMKGNWKDGEQEGLWRYFNKDGSFHKTKTWKDGIEVE